MSTEIYTVTAAAESADPVAVFLAIIAAILFLITIITAIADELEAAGFSFFIGAFIGVISLMMYTAPNLWDEENREIIAYSYNLEFIDPQQDISDDRGTTEGYVLFNDTDTVEYCVFERNATPEEDVDTLGVTCNGEPRPIRKHLQEN